MNKEAYVSGLRADIEKAKARGRTTVYRIRARIANSTANYVKEYFSAIPNYIVDVKPSCDCKNTWDIAILFK